MLVKNELKITQGFIDNLMREAIETLYTKKYSAEVFMKSLEECRIANELASKDLEKYGNRKSTTIIGGMRCGETTGWSEDGTFYMGNTRWHKSWRGIIPQPLYWYMVNATGINDYWTSQEKEVIKHRKHIITHWVFGTRQNATKVVRQYGLAKRTKNIFKKTEESDGSDNKGTSKEGITSNESVSE